MIWRLVLPALGAGGLILAIVGGALIGLFGLGVRVDLPALAADAYVWAVWRFTLWQAALSTVVSLAGAILLARAISRRPMFPGRRLLVRLLGLPMVVPTIVGTLGVVAVAGRSGWLNDGLALIQPAWRIDIYGMTGILLAHVFFNLPFAARLMLQALDGIPPETWRLASQLGMTGWQVFRLIEGPVIRRAAPGVAGLIFLLCFTSFAPVLLLGGGPPRATLEVAIYQSLRFDFDLDRVLALAALQVGTCCAAFLLVQTLGRAVHSGTDRPYRVARPDGRRRWGRIGDYTVILLGVGLLALPLAAVLIDGITGPVGAVLGNPATWAAAGRSLAVGLSAGGLALLLGWGLVLTARDLRVRFYRHRSAGLLEVAGALSLVIPPFVVAAGMFVLLRPVTDVVALGLGLVVLVNALMGLPFVIRVLSEAATDVAARHWRLADSLDIGGWRRFRLVDWPLLRRPAGLALAIVTCLSLGDFGVIALFGTRDTMTLPYLLYTQMGGYRLDEAAVTAVLLLSLCVGVFFAIEGLFGRFRTDGTTPPGAHSDSRA